MNLREEVRALFASLGVPLAEDAGGLTAAGPIDGAPIEQLPVDDASASVSAFRRIGVSGRQREDEDRAEAKGVCRGAAHGAPPDQRPWS